MISVHFQVRASLVAQMVKCLPARRETWVQSLGWEDPLKEGMATHSSVLAWRIPIERGAWLARREYTSFGNLPNFCEPQCPLV